MVQNGTVDPSRILTQVEQLSSAVSAYKSIDERQQGWIKVELQPGM
jgi:threonine dehydrogenase-like Zn-dependent dehydrogenase